MRRGWLALAAAAGVALASLPALAQLAEISRQSLPASPAVQRAYDAALQVEPMAAVWAPRREYRTPKAGVAATLGSALAALRAAARADPSNQPLHLALGVVAAEAYNLDISGAYGTAVMAFQDAAALAPADPRPRWMLGAFYCGTYDGVVRGMKKFLAVESRATSARKDANFWQAYLACATLAGMPEHALSAAARLQSLRPLSGADAALVTENRNLLTPPNNGQKYSPAQVWTVDPSGHSVYSAACGIALPLGSKWKWAFYALAHNMCMARAEPGLSAVRAGAARPTILLFAEAARPGQSLRALGKAFAHGSGARLLPFPACPAVRCFAYESRFHRGPSGHGGGYRLWTVFQTVGPRYPGLRWEHPQGPPAVAQLRKPGVQYWTPDQHLDRIALKMDYVVVLETAAPFGRPALAAYRGFLNGLVVDGPSARENAREPAATPRF